nr:putative leader peptide [Streptomyces megasporus]
MTRPSESRTGNRYDEPMVNHDVSENSSGNAPGALLVARLHVDLCRLTSAACRRRDRAHH